MSVRSFSSSTEHIQLRVYSREADLDNRNIQFIERLASPIVTLASSGEDSLLVYTSENILFHYIISFDQRSVKLVQVGQIALHGIIRAPSRVRAVRWILPDDQLGTYRSLPIEVSCS